MSLELYIFICVYTYMYVYNKSVCMSGCLPICVSTYPSTCLIIYLCFHLSICPSICLFSCISIPMYLRTLVCVYVFPPRHTQVDDTCLWIQIAYLCMKLISTLKNTSVSIHIMYIYIHTYTCVCIYTHHVYIYIYMYRGC